jgi:hypothetical protein
VEKVGNTASPSGLQGSALSSAREVYRRPQVGSYFHVAGVMIVAARGNVVYQGGGLTVRLVLPARLNAPPTVWLYTNTPIVPVPNPASDPDRLV